MRWHLARMHAYVFYILRYTLTAFNEEGRAGWAAFLLLSLSMTFVTFIGLCAIMLSLGRRYPAEYRDVARAASVGIAILVVGINFLTLMSQDQWRRYQHEFDHYPERIRVASGFAIWLGILAIFGALFWIGPALTRLPQ